MSNYKTCIVGIGNVLRTDDGAGAYICQALEEKKLPAVTIITTQQLDTAMLEALIQFDRVIFIDAAVKEQTVSFEQLFSANDQPASSSHQVNATLLTGLARELYSATTAFYICAIGATNFEMGNQLSEKSLSNANAAVSLLTEWILLNSDDEG